MFSLMAFLPSSSRRSIKIKQNTEKIMSTVIRRGVFETNSSSTHSICISKDGDYRLPISIEFVTGEFGWEVSELRSIEEKASYLYTGMLTSQRFDQLERLKTALADASVAATFQEYVIDEDGLLDDGYIDHDCDLTDFLDAVTGKDELFRYLFSDRSFILTGNDNGGDNYPDPSVGKTHDVYFKGN
jgi:hypothetical protein